MTQPLASVGFLEKLAPPETNKILSAPVPTGTRPFEKILNAKVTGAVSALQKTTKNFAMTIRDYWKSSVPALSVSRSVSATASPPRPANKDASAMSSKTPAPVLQEIHQAIANASEKYQIPHKLIESIVKAESAFNPHARSPVGAQGLMQLMPGTAAELGVKNPFNIQENIDGGVRYFKQMKEAFGSNEKALAAYNAGPGAVKRYGGVPPYAETRQYVQKILKYFESGKVS